MCRVWVFLGWINLGDFLIPPTMNLGSLHSIHGKEIPNQSVSKHNGFQPCHNHRRNACKSGLGIACHVDYAACRIVNKVLISPQICRLPCNQLLTGLVWDVAPVNIYIRLRMQILKCFMWDVVGWLRCRLQFNLLLQDRLDLPTMRMYGLCQCRSWLIYCNLFSNYWCEGVYWWPLGLYIAGWLMMQLIIGFTIFYLSIHVVPSYHFEINI